MSERVGGCAAAQVRAAQKGIPTGSVYETNEKNLATVGVPELQRALSSGDWDAVLERKDFKLHDSHAVQH